MDDPDHRFRRLPLGPEGLVEAVGQVRLERWEQVAVTVHRDEDRAVPEARADRVRVRSVSHGDGHGGVSQVVGPQA